MEHHVARYRAYDLHPVDINDRWSDGDGVRSAVFARQRAGAGRFGCVGDVRVPSWTAKRQLQRGDSGRIISVSHQHDLVVIGQSNG
ncbi:hypothetical protein D3C84_1191580 [compost metagenome]